MCDLVTTRRCLHGVAELLTVAEVAAEAGRETDT